MDCRIIQHIWLYDQGRRVDFKNAVIVMTSNVGAKNITEKQKTLGFAVSEQRPESSAAEIRSNVMLELRRTFKPEFLNRIDDIIVFHQLSREDIRKIASGMVREVAARLEGLGVRLEVEDSALELLADAGFDPVYGARPLRRAIQSTLEDKAAELLLSGALQKGGTALAKGEEGRVLLEAVKAESEDGPEHES